MSEKVSFDYSKAAPFISGNEVELMKKLALDGRAMISSAGSIFRRIMTRKSLNGSKRRRKRYRAIPRCCS